MLAACLPLSSLSSFGETWQGALTEAPFFLSIFRVAVKEQHPHQEHIAGSGCVQEHYKTEVYSHVLNEEESLKLSASRVSMTIPKSVLH